jgi:hypothetical protein
MLIGTFHARSDDWILPHKLRVLSAVCDAVLVMLDRSPRSEAICRRYHKVQVRHWQPKRDVPELASGHRACEEGAMRQACWDWAESEGADWVLLGDADETPGPDVLQTLADAKARGLDCCYADWINLCGDAGHAIGGELSPWSWQRPGSNKKGMLARMRPGVHYRDAIVHVRLEPSPVCEADTGYDDKHLLGRAPLVHWKWANWGRWVQRPEAKLPQWQPWPPADASIVSVPRSWLWVQDADEVLAALPEPIAVVGNGVFRTNYGKEIDRHASVIRFNNYRIVGKVGKKTTLWVTNCWDDVAMRPWTGDMLTVTTDKEQFVRNSKWLGAYPHMAIPRQSWVDDARELKPDNPSTGLTLLHRLSRHGKRVTAYGFDGFKTGHYWDPKHKHNHRGSPEALAALAARGIVFKS